MRCDTREVPSCAPVEPAPGDAEQHREDRDEDRDAHPHLHTSPSPPGAAERAGGRVEGGAVGVNAALLPAEASSAPVSIWRCGTCPTRFPNLFGTPGQRRRAGV